MIKFFRSIRQNMIKENRTSKYLLYAIGEIVLVVIGILIALSINNWNQKRIEQDKEHIYITNIKRDLEHQLDSIDVHLSFEKKYIDKAKPFLDSFFKNDRLTVDSSIMRNLSELTERKTFVRTDPTYTDLISSGNIDLLRDNSLKNKLIIYYQNLERIEKVIQNNNTQLIDQAFVSKIIGLILYNDGKLPLSKRLVDISKKILQKEENEILIVNLTSFRQSLAIRHTQLLLELKTQTKELLDIIDKLL